ncbi:Putative K(+)-stimulated pyrophosphate-energized sodium pump [Planctomycetes bacterium Poly30]|uniref:Putative K(+)-stimulated pyrophosphate-energized sodium pump n=1 Tax=Saltatorellus ferox TaxID=2528018 RepID=A0A518EXX7_9BACT|nr:Putative K(+)-stimulated pyrophosphate-energized sodium pump [Planctomycetes bacterium Poly30]
MTPLYVAGAAAVAALIFAIVKYFAIMKQDAGDAKMQEISKQVQEGAAAFLKAEYTWLSLFVIAVGAAIFFSDPAQGLGQKTAIAFVSGAAASAIAGYFGMHTATRAAVRTTQAARTGLSEALDVSFSSGIVMGMSVVGLALLGITIFVHQYAPDFSAKGLEYVLGFSFGASSIALFARVGGGIFTKAADVGADLVGKVEAGIPEDDPRNPATIADNVGDNVGDVAGMGADLFESYVGSIVAAMTLAAITFKDDPNMIGLAMLPLAVAAVGIFASIAGTFFVKAADEHHIHSALFRGMIVASLAAIAGSAVLCFTMDFPEGVNGMKLLIAIVSGVAVGVLIGKVTEYYTSTETKPVHTIANKSETGAATNIIAGLAVGMRSVALSVLLICVAIYVANWAGIVEGGLSYGVYCVALAAVGMLSTLGISLGVDAYGPVADNAGGLAEMAELPPEVRERTDALDAVGNTTAAIGKGFAIGSAALTALALFAAFQLRADELLAAKGAAALNFSLTNTEVLIGLLLGGILPFLFAALTMEAVGNAAQAMVEEVRRQFREIPGIMEGTGKPDAARCVKISTDGSLKQMVVPGLIAVGSPILVGLWSIAALGGLLAGALVTGIMMAIFMSNAGGAWDNAKKYIEGGAHGGKNSEPHKAAVVGDTVGDPFKDTSGPSLNILVKLMTVVGLVFLPWFV